VTIFLLIYPDMPKGVYDNIYGESIEIKTLMLCIQDRLVIYFFHLCYKQIYVLILADDLDDSPVTWHITEPVDPNEYQNEWLGSVINIY
jgi:hypothetical protein